MTDTDERRPPNRSNAVMATRLDRKGESLDDFPTPPWAVRGLMEHILREVPLPSGNPISHMSAWEPACGRGHMAQTLREYFDAVHGSDVKDYGNGAAVFDFTQTPRDRIKHFDFIITNPPFKHAECFIGHALEYAKVGVAVLVRSVFAESSGRYYRLFSQTPPTIIAQYAERVPMVEGRLDRKASTATSYAWFIWLRKSPREPAMWIPPCRADLERDNDYEPTFLTAKRGIITRRGD